MVPHPVHVRADRPRLVVVREPCDAEHLVDRAACVGAVDHPIQELVAERHRDEHTPPEVGLGGEVADRVGEDERQARGEVRLPGDRNVSPSCPRTHDLSSDVLGREQRQKVPVTSLTELVERAMGEELVRRRRRDRVREIDGEHLEQVRRDLALQGELVGIREGRPVDDPEIEPADELLGRQVVEDPRRGRDASDVVFDQAGPLAHVVAGAEGADVPETEGRAGPVFRVVGEDRHVAPHVRERLADQAAKVVGLLTREVREVFVGSAAGVGPLEQSHRQV